MVVVESRVVLVVVVVGLCFILTVRLCDEGTDECSSDPLASLCLTLTSGSVFFSRGQDRLSTPPTRTTEGRYCNLRATRCHAVPRMAPRGTVFESWT